MERRKSAVDRYSRHLSSSIREPEPELPGVWLGLFDEIRVGPALVTLHEVRGSGVLRIAVAADPSVAIRRGEDIMAKGEGR